MFSDSFNCHPIIYNRKEASNEARRALGKVPNAQIEPQRARGGTEQIVEFEMRSHDVLLNYIRNIVWVLKIRVDNPYISNRRSTKRYLVTNVCLQAYTCPNRIYKTSRRSSESDSRKSYK